MRYYILKMEKEIRNLIKEIVAEVVEEAYMSQSKDETTTEEKFLTVAQVCEKLQISRATLYRHESAGLIRPSMYVGRSPRFSENDLVKYYKS